MKILHFVPNLSRKSGICNVIFNYYKIINSDVIFDFIYFEETNTSSFENDLIEMGSKVYKITTPYSFFKFINSWNKFCLEHFGEYDIIHIHLPILNFMIKNAKEKLGVKKIISHAHATKCGDSKWTHFRNAPFVYIGRSVPDYYFACSQDAGIKMFGKFFENNKFIINNAIDVDKFLFNVNMRKKNRNLLGISDKFVIGHIGNFTPQKNHKYIIEIFYNFQKKIDNAYLILVGDGYLREDIRKMVKDRGLEEKVLFLGIVENINEILNSFDYFLFPSIFEGLGIALIEAQSNGLHCLSSDTIPIEANIVNNTRLSIDINPFTWAENIDINKVRDENVRKKVSDKGFDIKVEAVKLVEIYEKIIKDI